MNLESKIFEHILDTNRDPLFSADAKKILYSNDSEIWILFTADNLSQPERKSGDRVFITRFSEKIEDVFWLNGFYLVFNVGNIVKISEIDNRDQLNVFDFKEFPTNDDSKAKISFVPNSRDKKLYVLSNGNLYSSERLVP